MRNQGTKTINYKTSFDKSETIEIDVSIYNVIKPIVQKSLPKFQKEYEKHKDILESGEASNRQQNKYWESKERLEFIEAFISKMK